MAVRANDSEVSKPSGPILISVREREQMMNVSVSAPNLPIRSLKVESATWNFAKKATAAMDRVRDLGTA